MRAARVRAPGSSPSHLGPPKARSMSISWKAWASPGSPSPADAHDACACCAHHELKAAGGSSIIEFAGAAPRRPKTCPNATRNACVFRSHSPANFEFPRPCQRPRSGTPATRRRRVGGNGVFFIKASPLRLKPWRPTAAPAEGARCAARFNGCRQCRRPRRAVGTGISQASPNSPKVCRWGFWSGWECADGSFGGVGRGWACIGDELNCSITTRTSQAIPNSPKVCRWGFWRGWEGLGMHWERIKLLH